MRDGELHAIEEARLNALQARLFNPLQRLKEEQFVHQSHSFSDDNELLGAVKGLTEVAVPVQVPTVAIAALVKTIGPLLPTISPPRRDGNLPWPDPPAPFEVEREPHWSRVGPPQRR